MGTELLSDIGHRAQCLKSLQLRLPALQSHGPGDPHGGELTLGECVVGSRMAAEKGTLAGRVPSSQPVTQSCLRPLLPFPADSALWPAHFSLESRAPGCIPRLLLEMSFGMPLLLGM